MSQQKPNNGWMVILPLICLMSSQAFSQTVYDTTNILQQKHNACANSNSTVCQSVPLDRVVIGSGDSTTINAKCPSDHPVLVGWDATRNEHITADLSPKSLTDNSMRLVIGNHADKKGFIKVFLGCATDRLAQKGNATVQESLGANPTNIGTVNQ